MPSHPAVTEAELALLERLWTSAPQTARELVSALYPEQTPSDVATVQKLIQRLETKQLVQRNRRARVHTFEPTVSRATYAGSQLSDMADRLNDGSLAPLMLHLVHSRKLKPNELAELRQVLDVAIKSRKDQP